MLLVELLAVAVPKVVKKLLALTICCFVLLLAKENFMGQFFTNYLAIMNSSFTSYFCTCLFI